MNLSNDLASSQSVTASQLVRNFGLWQDRATRQPIYIMHRGRPRLALASVELLESLSASGPQQRGDWPAERELLLDQLTEMVLMFDNELRVTGANLAARTYLKASSQDVQNATLTALIPGELGSFLADAARRSISTRVADRVEIGDASVEQRLAITMVPLPSGIAVLARDISCEDALLEARTAVEAVDGALREIDGLACVRINLRGYLDTPTQSLTRLTGLTPAALAAVRFVGLFDIRSRPEIGEAIERVARDRQATHVSARLLVNGAAARDVRIGLSPIVERLAVKGVQGVIVADFVASAP